MYISLLGVARGARWDAAADPQTERAIGNDINPFSNSCFAHFSGLNLDVSYPVWLATVIVAAREVWWTPRVLMFVLHWSAAPRDPLLLFNASVSGVSVGPVPVETWRSVNKQR